MNQEELRGLERIPDDQWEFYREAIEGARQTGEPFALGGAFAWAAHTGLYRNTKDLDLYVFPEAKEKFIAMLSSIGAKDYFDTLEYDRGWIYRSHRGAYIIDIIFDTANYVRPLDLDYLTRGPRLIIRGEEIPVLPAEELLMNKLYIMSRNRCDWFDVFNLLYCTEGTLDWERLVAKMGQNLPLLASAVNAFAWLAPGRAAKFPADLWQALGLTRPTLVGPEYDEKRVRLLDTRPWFIPALAPGEQMFVAEK